MRVIFVHDFAVQQWLGGAQLEVEWMMEIGRRMGHECLLMTPEKYDRKEISSADLIILNNIMRFSNQEINWITREKRYIRWEHDYSFTQLGRRELFINIFRNSLCNIFLSPLHFEEHQKNIPLEESDNLVMPSPMNTDLFTDLNLERDIDFLYVGRLSPPKGVGSVLLNAMVNPNKKFCFVGSGPMDKVIEEVVNCKLLGEIPNQKMAEVYSRAKFLIHLPMWMEPFGQVVVQAKLCNCSLIINQNVGALSFDWFFSENDILRAILRDTPFKVWEKIREIYESSASSTQKLS